ncbi:MAG TPA: ABC transporter substrate-binding protein [Chloroflexota bacterium]|nr:ABC transporter substrate-binding protein [Chloroflexota bacterium]
MVLTVACAPTSAGRAPAAAPAGVASGGTADVAASAAPASLTQVRMGVTGHSPTYWHAYIATRKGFFAQEGLDFDTIVIPSSVTQTQALIAGDVNFNSYSVDSVAKAVVGGAPLKLIGSAQEVPNFLLIVDHDITTWNDLRGKTLGAGSPGGYYDIVLRAMLAANGLQPGDYELRSIGNSSLRLPAIQTGQIAGAIMGDPDAFVARSAGYQPLGSVHDYVHDVQYTGYAIADEWGKAHEALVVGFLRGILRAIAWINDPANKDEAERIYGEITGLGGPYLDDIYDQMVTQKMLSTTARPNMKGLENITNLAYQQGSLNFAPPLDTWVDMSYLDKAIDQQRRH